MMALAGGSFGLQLGGQGTDFVPTVMNERCARGILSSKVKMGRDASAAGGQKAARLPRKRMSRQGPKYSSMLGKEGLPLTHRFDGSQQDLARSIFRYKALGSRLLRLLDHTMPVMH
jgi:lipid-binding SYLF domain-containing protein